MAVDRKEPRLTKENGSGRSTEAIARRALHPLFGSLAGVTIEMTVPAGKDILIAEKLIPVIEKAFKDYGGNIPVKSKKQLSANWDQWLKVRVPDSFDQLVKISDGCVTVLGGKDELVHLNFCLLPDFRSRLSEAIA